MTPGGGNDHIPLNLIKISICKVRRGERDRRKLTRIKSSSYSPNYIVIDAKMEHSATALYRLSAKGTDQKTEERKEYAR